MTIHTFEDASLFRDSELGVESIDTSTCSHVLAHEYTGRTVLEFNTAGETPWLELDTVVRLRDMLTEWIEQHPDNQP